MKRTLVCVFFVALTSVWAINELVPPFGFRWGDPPRRVESVLTGSKGHIVDRKQVGNRESWSVDRLIHPGLQRTVFTFRHSQLLAVELQYASGVWSLERS